MAVTIKNSKEKSNIEPSMIPSSVLIMQDSTQKVGWWVCPEAEPISTSH